MLSRAELFLSLDKFPVTCGQPAIVSSTALQGVAPVQFELQQPHQKLVLTTTNVYRPVRHLPQK